MVTPHLAQDFVAGGRRHGHVEQHDVRSEELDGRRASHPSGRGLNVVADGGDHVAQNAQDLEVVIDDQNARHRYVAVATIARRMLSRAVAHTATSGSPRPARLSHSPSKWSRSALASGTVQITMRVSEPAGPGAACARMTRAIGWSAGAAARRACSATSTARCSRRIRTVGRGIEQDLYTVSRL